MLTTSIGRGTPTFWVLPTESKHETNDSDCNEATQVEKAYNLAGGFGKVGSTDGLATLIFILDAEACALVVGVVIVVLATCFDDDLVWIIYNLS